MGRPTLTSSEANPRPAENVARIEAEKAASRRWFGEDERVCVTYRQPNVSAKIRVYGVVERMTTSIFCNVAHVRLECGDFTRVDAARVSKDRRPASARTD